MAVDDLVTTAERAAQIARKLAAELLAEDQGHEARVSILGHIAAALERDAREALAAPNETPPSGFNQLINELEQPTPVTRRLARRLTRGRSIVRRLLAAAEITGDIDLIAEAQAWLDDT